MHAYAQSQLPVDDLLPDGGAHAVTDHDAHAVLCVDVTRRLGQQVAAHLSDVLRHLDTHTHTHTQHIITRLLVCDYYVCVFVSSQVVIYKLL